jgi:oligosaccharyltransferase complex subunit alpha (ribophorin I)
MLLQLYFKFNTIAMLAEPLMLVAGFFLFFVSCIAYARFDFSISKSSASYQARIQREEVNFRICFL